MIKRLFNFFFRYEQSLKKSAVQIHHENFEKADHFIEYKYGWPNTCDGIILDHNQFIPYVDVFVSTNYNLMKDVDNGGYYPFAFISEREGDLRMLIFRDAKEQYDFCKKLMDPDLHYDQYMGESLSKGLFKSFRIKNNLIGFVFDTKIKERYRSYKAEELFLVDMFCIAKLSDLQKGRVHEPEYIKEYKERINEVK